MKINSDTISTLLICVALILFVIYMISNWGIVAFISGVCLFSGVAIKFAKEKIENRRAKKSKKNNPEEM